MNYISECFKWKFWCELTLIWYIPQWPTMSQAVAKSMKPEKGAPAIPSFMPLGWTSEVKNAVFLSWKHPGSPQKMVKTPWSLRNWYPKWRHVWKENTFSKESIFGIYVRFPGCTWAQKHHVWRHASLIHKFPGVKNAWKILMKSHKPNPSTMKGYKCLFSVHRGWNATQLYRDYVMNQYKDPY